MEKIVEDIFNKIDKLNIYEKPINELLKTKIEKKYFSIFGSDYKTFNQNIEKTKSYLNNNTPESVIDTLKNPPTLSSIILFLKYSEDRTKYFSNFFDDLYVFFVKNNVKMLDDSKLNRQFFKALSRLSFFSNWKNIFPQIKYEISFLEEINSLLDNIVKELKAEWERNNPTQWNKSNIISWITNVWIIDENIKIYLSLFWEEQDNMYEQKLWFFISYLIKKWHPLEMVIEENYLKHIKSINAINSYNTNNLIKEPEIEYNKPNLSSNVSSMEKLTSQEWLLLLSLLTKPFSILYWVSWTWKSRVVKELWRKMYWENYTNYFYKEAVPPNWFDETEILWRYNEIEKYKEGSFIKVLEKAIKDTKNQYVYLLDEMNLSHIEQYFAQYLSAIEDLNNWNALINVWEKSNYIIWSIDWINFEKYNKEKDYLIKYYLNFENFEKLSFTNNKKIINSINKVNYSWNYNGKKLKWVSLKWEILSFSSNRKLYNFLIQYLIDNYFDNLETIQEYKNIISRNKEDLTYWDYAIEEYNWFFYANNFSTNETIKHLFDLINKYAEWINNDDILLLTDEVELLEQEWYINNLNKIDVIWKSLKLPKNLFVVWTINLDETTKSISPKVVDRANLIEFNDLDNFLFIEDNNKYDLDFLNNINLSNFLFNDFIELRTKIINNSNEEDLESLVKLDKKTKKLLNRFYQFLKIFKLHFSYRTLKEIIIFIAIWKKLWLNEDQLFDLAIMQKILPKLNWVIDYSFKLYTLKDQKLLSYDLSLSDNQLLLLWFDWIENWVISWENVYKNTSLKLKRMQQFFDNYQNVNYFLS